MVKLRTRFLFLWVLILLYAPIRIPSANPAIAQTRPAAGVPAPSWQFVIAMADPVRGLLDVTMTVYGLSGNVRLCLFMEDAERHLRTLKRHGKGPAIYADDDCWTLPAAQPQGTTLSYTYDLYALADHKNDPDYATRIDSTYLFNDQAVLLHPAPLPKSASIEVEFRLPSGLPLITPWARTAAKDSAPRYRFDSTQHDGGSYLGIGSQLLSLGPLPAGRLVAQLYLVDLPHRTSATALRAWMGGALSLVTRFYGELLSREAVIILVPVPGNREPGVFGTVVRRGVPAIIIYFGADCPKPTMHDDWVGIHELFHIGNPLLKRKISWFVEGFTTYYQDVLRARARALSPEEAWSDLYDGFRRFCQPAGSLSLADESRELRRTHRYTRVYWGGACAAFLADVAIREHSQGRSSLDEVLRSLRKRSLLAPLDEDTILSALDAETGGRFMRNLLSERRAIALDPWYRRLGIEPIGPAAVRLIDTAPLAALRKAIFAPPLQPEQMGSLEKSP